MICQKCGNEFDPPEETAHLMRLGKVYAVCRSCEIAPPAPLTAPRRKVIDSKRSPKSRLHRIDWFTADETLKFWMSLPPRFPRPERAHGRKLGRRDDGIEAFVMSTTKGRLTGMPHLFLRHNLDTFRVQGRAFFAEKIPGFATLQTGQERIEIPQDQIKGVEDDGGLEVTIRLADGGRVRLQFRNT